MKTILLVEDNRSDEKLALLAFRQHGMINEIVVARDGIAALDYLSGTSTDPRFATSGLPALVLLDLKLPQIDGLEVLRRIRADARTRFLPVTILTASAEDEDVVRAYQLGANAYVRKPVDFAEFTEVAGTIGRFWLLINESAASRRWTP